MPSSRWLRAALALSRIYDSLALDRVPGLKRAVKLVSSRIFSRSPDLPCPFATVRTEDATLRVPKQLAGPYVLRHFEALSRRIINPWLRPGDVVIDVGANIGFYTVRFARRVGPRGRVLALEPAPDNLAFLRKNVQANHLEHVQVLPLAAGAARAERPLFLHSHGALHGFYPRDRANAEHVLVEQCPLDELVEGRVDFVKIDTEGAEMEVLAGMGRILEANPGIKLLVEWNLLMAAKHGGGIDELPAYLRRQGFTVRVIDDLENRVCKVEEVLESVRSATFGELRALNLAAERSQATVRNGAPSPRTGQEPQP